MTPEVALLVATLCGGDHIDPIFMVRHAKVESGLRSDAVGPRNSNGTHDYGITQINERNFGLLNVDAASLIDQTPIVVGGHTVERGACLAFRAQGDWLRMLSRYNAGRPDSTVGQAYAQKVLAHTTAPTTDIAEIKPSPSQQCEAPAWDTWAQEACKSPPTGDNQ